MTSKNWVLKTVCLTLALLMLLAFAAYAVDPFYSYRSKSDDYVLNARFVNAGIIKNNSYDTVMIGSSMVQNFNMRSFREKLNCEPIKMTLGGISLSETELLTKLIIQENKCKTMYVCLDLKLYSNPKNEDKMRFPKYLYDANVFNDYRYLLGYEAWMRFIPIDLGLKAIDLLGVSLPSKLKQSTDIDFLEYWQDDYVFGKNVVKKNYLDEKYNATAPKLDSLAECIELRFNEHIKTIEDSNIEYVFFFPPYSALFWYQTKEQGYYDIYQDAKKFIVKEIENELDYEVFDFQCMPLISDLDYYKDPTHYSAGVNEMMVDLFASGDYKVNCSNVNSNINTLNYLVEQFASENSDWLK